MRPTFSINDVANSGDGYSVPLGQSPEGGLPSTVTDLQHLGCRQFGGMVGLSGNAFVEVPALGHLVSHIGGIITHKQVSGTHTGWVIASVANAHLGSEAINESVEDRRKSVSQDYLVTVPDTSIPFHILASKPVPTSRRIYSYFSPEPIRERLANFSNFHRRIVSYTLGVA